VDPDEVKQVRKKEANRPPSRRVVIVATPSAQSLEVAGPVEVFSIVNEKLREAGRELIPGYAVEVVSATEDLTIRSSSGLRMLADRSFRQVDYGIDTLLVAGGTKIWSGAGHEELLQWIRDRSAHARRYGSICTGAFVLAEAGLLKGKRVTTHWYFCQQLQKDYPDVIVDPQPIFIREDSLYTSAGVTTGVDMSVALVEEDCGLDIALRVARALVLFLRRPAGQSQFSAALQFQSTWRVPMRELPVYVLEHLQETLSIEQLAKQVSMSPRNFSRAFKQEFESTPAAFVEQLRAETAKRLVEDSTRGFAEIATECGIGSEDTLARLMSQYFGKTPSQLRKQARIGREP